MSERGESEERGPIDLSLLKTWPSGEEHSTASYREQTREIIEIKQGGLMRRLPFGLETIHQDRTERQVAFRLTRMLDAGEINYIFLAERYHINVLMEEVIIKLPHEKFDYPEGRASIRREYEILSDLQHPCIVRAIGLHEVYFPSGCYERGRISRLCLELEKGPETTLGNLLAPCCRETIFSLAATLRFLIKLAETLCYLHSKGVVHCDLSANNILIQEREDKKFLEGIKIIDFETARNLEEGKEEVFGEVVRSTKGAAPPEVSNPTAIVTFGVDIYAFGALISWLLLGGWPTEQIQLADHHGVHRESPILPELEDLFQSCIEPDVQYRCQDIQLVLSALLEMQKKLPERYEPDNDKPE